MNIESAFNLFQNVRIKEIGRPAVITAINVDSSGLQYLCRWFMNGEIKTGYLLAEEIEPQTQNEPMKTSPAQKISFSKLRKINSARCDFAFHPIDAWTPAEWGLAVAGEVGELCNVIKKLRRIQDGTNTAKDPQTVEECRALVAKEAADAVIYLDLLCARLRIDLGEAVRQKFNEVSDLRGVNFKL